MPATVEQQALTQLIRECLEQMQRAVVAALPGNTALHDEFLIGRALPSSVVEVVRHGRQVAPAAREYRALLLNRGLDAAALARFNHALAALEATASLPVTDPDTSAGSQPVSQPGAPKRKRSGTKTPPKPAPGRGGARRKAS